MGFANVWGSHPKDNAKGGRAWYVGDVLFPNEMMREIFFSLFRAFFFFQVRLPRPHDERGWRRDDEPKARRICANGFQREITRVDIVSIRFRNRRDDRLAVYNEGSLFAHSARFNRFFPLFFLLSFLLWWTRLTFLLFLCYSCKLQ